VTAAVVVVAVALGTFALRASTLGRRTVERRPARVDVVLAFVGPAAMGALLSSRMVVESGRPAVPGLPEVVAVAVGFVAVRRSGNMALAVLLGLPTLWLLGWALG